MSKLSNLPFEEVLAVTEAALGRCPRDAEKLEQTRFNDCVRNDFWFADGACYSQIHDNQEEATAQAERHGFFKH